MHVHHWLGWLAVNLAMLWLGVEMSQPPPEPVAMAAFDDVYLVPTEFPGSDGGGVPLNGLNDPIFGRPCNPNSGNPS